MKVITVPETGIRIEVTNAEEMFRVFYRLHPYWNLEVDGKLYEANTSTGYTRGYFVKFFVEG